MCVFLSLLFAVKWKISSFMVDLTPRGHLFQMKIFVSFTTRKVADSSDLSSASWAGYHLLLEVESAFKRSSVFV